MGALKSSALRLLWTETLYHIRITGFNSKGNLCNVRKDSVSRGGRADVEGYLDVYQQCCKNACE